MPVRWGAEAMRITYSGPDIRTVIKGAIKEFMPKAGDKIRQTAKDKLGRQQPGHAKLAESTIRKKRKRKLISGRHLYFNRIKSDPMTGIGSTPLVDRGFMLASIKHFETGNSTHIVADYPMNLHEQDPEVGTFNVPPSWRNAKAGEASTKRPVMGPALDECVPQLADEAADFIGSRI